MEALLLLLQPFFVTAESLFVTLLFVTENGNTILWLQSAVMYKFLFLLVFLLAISSLSFALMEKKHTVEICSPAVNGSPILVLNQQ